MTGEAAPLIAAVCARPDDVTPRLVFADWLDDGAGAVPCPTCRGDTRHRLVILTPGHTSEVLVSREPGTCKECDGRGWVPDAAAVWAAFIRVQCKLAEYREQRAAIPGGPDGVRASPPGDPRRGQDDAILAEMGPWLGREQLLFARLPAEAKYLTRPGDDADMLGFTVCVDRLEQWRRGFPEVLRDIDGPFWVQHGDEILTRAPVRRVELRTWPGNPGFSNHPAERLMRFWLRPGGAVLEVTEQRMALRRGDGVSRGELLLEIMADLCESQWPGIEFVWPNNWQRRPDDFSRALRMHTNFHPGPAFEPRSFLHLGPV